ncbi:MAG: acyl-ACP--UDP-N-acetylglucosamine O-acyltransferase [Planctomycetota bacterium]|nr:acyl-ACP--UDP-N-acetylglucosamine O-acyltransferase [Planctomycetota bacterium]
MAIHPAAMVDRRAEIGAGVEIGPYAVIDGPVKIGRDTIVMAHAHISGHTEIGEGCRIHMGAVVGHEPQDHAYKGEPSRTLIGNRVTIREYAQVHRATGEGNATVIGDDCFLMATSHVGHNCRLGRGVHLANCALLAGHVTVEDAANISGGVAIHQFVRVGMLAMLSGGSRFSMDIPPFSIGDGANSISGLNVVGIRRWPAFTAEDRAQIRDAFRLIFRSGKPLGAAVAEAEGRFASPAARMLIGFLKTPTRRGICRYNPRSRREDGAEEA